MSQPTIAPLLLLLASAACSSPAAGPPEARSETAALASDETADAFAAARSGLGRYLDLIPAEQRPGYGFASREEQDRAQLGAPYRVWTADSARVEAGPDAEAIRAVREWRFPVTVDGEFRALLTVAAVDGALKAVDFGAAGLATELGRLERRRGPPADARRVLLRLYELRADFASFPAASARVEDSAFEPLVSARAHPRAPAEPVALPRLLPWLRERLREARPR